MNYHNGSNRLSWQYFIACSRVSHRKFRNVFRSTTYCDIPCRVFRTSFFREATWKKHWHSTARIAKIQAIDAAFSAIAMGFLLTTAIANTRRPIRHFVTTSITSDVLPQTPTPRRFRLFLANDWPRTIPTLTVRCVDTRQSIRRTFCC